MDPQSWKPLTRDLRSLEDVDLRYLLEKRALVGGKQLRMKLGRLWCEALHVAITENTMRMIEAGELLHAATLVHDDVIDHSLTRRGQPCLHTLIGNRRAVLSGDYLLATVIRWVAESQNLRALKAVSHCLEELTEGELLQLELYEQLKVDQCKLERIAIKKTGELYGWVCAIAAFSLENESIERDLMDFGRQFGLAFQMRDDILDFERSSGKPCLQDLADRRLNIVSLKILQSHPELENVWTWNPQSPAWSLDQQFDAIRQTEREIEALQLALKIRLEKLLPSSSTAKNFLNDCVDSLQRNPK